VVCTWFLQTSMCLFFKARTDVARMGFAFYGPFAFVIGATHPRRPAYGADVGPGLPRTAHQYRDRTVGNLIGGTLFVAVPFQLVTTLQAANR
jgi:formate/nitrite transporter FocA (FNT family)